MTDRQLGMTWQTPTETAPVRPKEQLHANTRTSLWPERWPAIALQECIDIVEASPVDKRVAVKQALPCQDCPANVRCLNAKRKELGPLLYDREEMTRPRSSESSLFPREIWEPMLLRTETCVPYWHKPFGLEHEYGICQAWDIAWSEKIGGDFLVCATGYVHKPTGTRRLLDIERWQQKTFDAQVKMIEGRWKQYMADLVVIESDAAQQIWTQHVGRNTAVPVMPHNAQEKRDFAVGVPGLLISFDNQKWEIPYARGSRNFEHVDTMLDEFEAFGWNDGKLEGVGEHDDTVMCFWHLDWGLKRLLFYEQGGTEHHRGNVPGARQ